DGSPGEALFNDRDFAGFLTERDFQKATHGAAFNEQQTVLAKAAHAVRALNRTVKCDLGNRTGLTVLLDRHVEQLARAQSVHYHAIAEHGDTVHDCALCTERTVVAGPHFERRA